MVNMALSQLFWDVLMPWNLKLTYFSLKMIHFLSLNIWYVIYVVFWIKYWNLKLTHHCILFLFTICTVSQLFWNRVLYFKCTFMHLADAFIQSDLQCIQAMYILSVSVFPGNWTHNLCTANAMLYHWATGTYSRYFLVTCNAGIPKRFAI